MTVTSPSLLKLSQLVGSAAYRTVIELPYCGVPSVSHQFPVDVVVTVFVERTVEVAEVVEVTAVVVVIVVVDEGGTVVEVGAFVVVVVADEQDANTIEIAMIQVINTPIIPFFISPPVLFRLYSKSIKVRFEK
jgi:hypothetical protein